jgi:hypothetical protein
VGNKIIFYWGSGKLKKENIYRGKVFTTLVVFVLCNLLHTNIAQAEQAASQTAPHITIECSEPLCTYLSGYVHTVQILDKPVEWYRKAAQQGSALAQAHLGQMLYTGTGVTRDYQESFKWFLAAAEQKDPVSQNALCTLYMEGSGVAKDSLKAFEWCKKSAVQSYPNGMFQLGLMYLLGEGTKPNVAEASRLMNAAAKGTIGVQKRAEKSKNAQMKNQQTANQTLPPVTIACSEPLCMHMSGYKIQNFDKPVEWYRKAAEQGSASAQAQLGQMFYTGTGVTQSYQESFKWFLAAAEQNDPVAQNAICTLYMEGSGVAKDSVKGLEWCKKSAAHSYSNGIFQLGLMYLIEEGTKLNIPEAAQLIHEAAEKGSHGAQNMTENSKALCMQAQNAINSINLVKNCFIAATAGDAIAQSEIGHLYYKGKFLEMNRAEAVKWFRRAAEQGEAGSQMMLGITYAKGVGVPFDLAEAYAWLSLSAQEQNDQYGLNINDMALGVRMVLSTQMRPEIKKLGEARAKEYLSKYGTK